MAYSSNHFNVSGVYGDGGGCVGGDESITEWDNEYSCGGGRMMEIELHSSEKMPMVA